MKKLCTLLLLLALTLLCGCGKEKAAVLTPEDKLCAAEGCDQVVAEDAEYCSEHAGECASCGKRIPEGETLCADCIAAQLDSLEPTHSKSDIAAYN